MEPAHRTDPPPVAEAPGPDPAFVGRLVAVRPEPSAEGEPPTAADLDAILAVATTVPDHGDLTPWRFVVCSGAGRDRFAGDEVPEAVVAKMRSKAHAAPCSVVLVASPDPSSNVEVWEQVASASCTGYAIVLAATGLGYGAVWKSAPVLGAGPVRDLFGCTPDETLLGWVNIGTPAPLGRKGLVHGSGVDLDGRVLRLDG